MQLNPVVKYFNVLENGMTCLLTGEVYEYTEVFFGSLVYLTRITPQTGLISQEHGLRYAGKWHGQKLNVIGEKKAPKIYQAAVEDFENISQSVKAELDRFIEHYDPVFLQRGVGLKQDELSDFEKKQDEFFEGL